MNHKAHIVLSIIVAVGLWLIVWKLNILSLTIYSLPMYFTTTLPDFIEPAVSPNHRSYFHSKRFFKLLSVCLGLILVYASFIDQRGFFYFFGIFGYMIHMIVDSTTFKGMPN